jgi:DNA-binding IclR family transcriptional regulator
MAKTPAAASAVQVIDRMAHLLDALGTSSEALSLKVLSAETALHPSTALRILSSLACHGLVERTSEGRYRLGTKLLRYGGQVHAQVDLRAEARPIMEWLRSQVDETVNLTVREGNEVMYVERAVANRMMRVEQVIGSRAPLHVTAVGKLFLGETGEKACRDYARSSGLAKYTPNSITTMTRLWQEADKARKQGYALDNEEAELGVGCIAVPVRDHQGEMIAGLSISCPRDRRRDSWIALIRQAGEQLSTRLGYGSTRPH